MAKYRKRPVVIEAFRFSSRPVVIEAFRFSSRPVMFGIGTNNREIPGPVPKWFDHALAEGSVTFRSGVDHGFVDIHTLEGMMRAEEGDYIIQGVKGEIYPCKPDIFEATYDTVE